jgi:hypothetical protein
LKELLTLKEAASLTGKTTKTIKNYIKRGTIRNFFFVEGKFGKEYRINVRELEPILKKAQGKSPGKKSLPREDPAGGAPAGGRSDGEPLDDIYRRSEYKFLLRRNEEILMKLGKVQGKVKDLERENLALKQELEEKNNLIEIYEQKSHPRKQRPRH